jgi:cell division protein FtsW
VRPDKYNDPITSDNQQEQYSFIAQANGGIFGVFPGNSRETARLPLAFSDYIYAIVIEDTGLVGGVTLLLLYLWLLARAGRIAMKCKKAFPALLVIGMSVFIVYQALFHMAIVTGCMPVSGQPLPLISKGGSSVIITSVALGMMLSVSRFAERKGIKQEVHDNISALSDSDMPDNPTQI